MLQLTDWVLELLSMERTPFRAYTVSALLLALLALLFRTLLQLGSSWHRYYVNCQRLRCFPEPPRRNWLLGHLGMFIPGEEGLSSVSQTVATLSQAFVTWMGPFLPVLSLVHPDYLKPITTASAELWWQLKEEGRDGGTRCQIPAEDQTCSPKSGWTAAHLYWLVPGAGPGSDGSSWTPPPLSLSYLRWGHSGGRDYCLPAPLWDSSAQEALVCLWGRAALETPSDGLDSATLQNPLPPGQFWIPPEDGLP